MLNRTIFKVSNSNHNQGEVTHGFRETLFKPIARHIDKKSLSVNSKFLKYEY